MAFVMGSRNVGIYIRRLFLFVINPYVLCCSKENKMLRRTKK